MFVKQKLTYETSHVIAESSDATHYDFVVIRHYDDFLFAPLGSTFRFPQKINKYELPEGKISVNCEEVSNVSEREHCNPWTVVMCMKTIRNFEKGKW